MVGQSTREGGKAVKEGMRKERDVSYEKRVRGRRKEERQGDRGCTERMERRSVEVEAGALIERGEEEEAE